MKKFNAKEYVKAIHLGAVLAHIKDDRWLDDYTLEFLLQHKPVNRLDLDLTMYSTHDHFENPDAYYVFIISYIKRVFNEDNITRLLKMHPGLLGII